MAKYRKVKKLSPEEAAYLAGLIDGEGTIALTRKHRGKHRQLMVSISGTEQPLLKENNRRGAYYQQMHLSS